MLTIDSRSFGRGAALATALLLAAAGTPAADETNTSQGMTAAGAPLAMHGYDPVAYFKDGVAMRGSAKHQTKHKGSAYRFVSEDHRRAFDKNPDRYLPRYGGFCAYGVSVGKKFDGDPRVWKIVDDRLYFNLNPEIKATWVKDVPGNIRKADKQWATIRTKAASQL